MGVNQFTALSDVEFVATYLGSWPPTSEKIEIVADAAMVPANDVDWTGKAVSPIKNQGQCGSCWAFSATGVIESWAMMQENSWNLSEQQLVDCTRNYGNYGCNGGWPSSALQYVKAGGITGENDYPYTARDGTCRMNGGNFKIPGFQSATGCSALQNAIQNSPVSVTVDATNWSRYSSGIFSNCGTSINHAVLLVGSMGGNWKIKNSWGTGWGESGFIRLAGGNTCGVCMYGSPYIA